MMKYKVTLLFVILIISTSANYAQDTPVPYNIQNPELVEHIKQYISQVELNTDEKVINLIVQKVQNRTIVYLYYETSAFAFTLMHPLSYTVVDDELVVLTLGRNNLLEVNHSFLWDVLKDKFPKQYKYYNRLDNFPPPNTGTTPIWKLTFEQSESVCVDKNSLGPYLYSRNEAVD